MTTKKPARQDEELKQDDRPGDSETDAVIKRGQEAIKANQLIDQDSSEEQEKDAEQWRNEG